MDGFMSGTSRYQLSKFAAPVVVSTPVRGAPASTAPVRIDEGFDDPASAARRSFAAPVLFRLDPKIAAEGVVSDRSIDLRHQWSCARFAFPVWSCWRSAAAQATHSPSSLACRGRAGRAVAVLARPEATSWLAAAAVWATLEVVPG